jgi:hypothetical protein
MRGGILSSKTSNTCKPQFTGLGSPSKHVSESEVGIGGSGGRGGKKESRVSKYTAPNDPI